MSQTLLLLKITQHNTANTLSLRVARDYLRDITQFISSILSATINRSHCDYDLQKFWIPRGKLFFASVQLYTLTHEFL